MGSVIGRHQIDIIALLLVVSGFFAGCQSEATQYYQSLEVQRNGWDTLLIHVDFSKHSAFRTLSVEPLQLDVTVYDAEYDTLYSGGEQIIPIADRDLESRERLMIEVCGEVENVVLCEQRRINASPKRIIIDHEISYPEDGGYSEGSYNFKFRVQRRQFDEEEWENISRKKDITGYVLAYVEDEQRTAIRVPFFSRDGRFDLKRHRQFKDFTYHIQSALFDGREARIRFDVYAGLGGEETKLASVQKFIHRKTEADRREEVQLFVTQAVKTMIDKMGISSVVEVYVDDWHFDEPLRSYLVDLEVRWRSGFFDRHGFRGELRVQENGSDARFHFEQGSRRVNRLWRGEYGTDEIFLGRLEFQSPEQQEL